MEYKQINQENMFKCYSINLFHFLKGNGFFYLVKGYNDKTKKNYWLFEKTPEFLEALTFFSNNKGNKQIK